MLTRAVCGACVVLLGAISASGVVADDYKTTLPADHPAIRYGDVPVHDAAAAFAQRLADGTLTLARGSDPLGYLPAVLEQLHVSTDSQMLVFSKTSFQAARISPDNPRAIYFNDDVVVAYVPGGPTLEVAATDAVQGPIFYTVSLDASAAPKVERREACLRCHHGANTSGVPGLYVGSVIPGPSGAPLRDNTAIITDHRSEFRGRWGGWYVTARRGEQPDRANAVASNPADPETLVREARQNLPSLVGLVDLSRYAAETSDIVALMTFEHQTQMTNLITRVGWEARIAAHAATGNAAADAALTADINELVAYMVFSREAPLTQPIEGVSPFTRTFAARGPKDRQGRSLRDFDLHTRMFRYPLSYMIYSAAFDALPDAVRGRVYRRLFDVLAGKIQGPDYAHLTAADRRAIVEILLDTKPTLPPGWRDAHSPAAAHTHLRGIP